MIKNNYTIVNSAVFMEIKHKEQNFTCAFDIDDLDKVSKLDAKWFVRIRNNKIESVFCNKGSGKSKKSVYLHRVIMNFPSGLVIDHIDRNPLNNRKENLRKCTKEENNRNRNKVNTVKGETTTSIYKGVWKSKISGNYKINVNKIRVTFSNEIAAANYYNHMAIQEYGEYASLNDVDYMSVEECEKYKVIKTHRKPEKPSKYKGVGWDKSKNKWVARYYDKIDKKRIYLGSFETEEMAYESIQNYANGVDSV